MPEYTIRDPKTNRTITLRGDSPPTEAELEQVFSAIDANGSKEPGAVSSALSSLRKFTGEASQSLNPMNIVRGVSSTVLHPVQTVQNVLSAQDAVRLKAVDAYKRGDYTTAAAKGLEWLIPFIGPRMSESGDLLQAGETARGLGAAVDAGIQVATPELARRAGSVKLGPLKRASNPVVDDAVQYGQRAGIPVDAATATNSPMVARLQKRVSDTMGGAGVAERFKSEQAAALTREGQRLAERTRAGQTVAPEIAGQSVRDAIQARVNDFKAQADTAYDALRTIENDPKNTVTVRMKIPMTDLAGNTTMQTASMPMQLPVDLKAAKTALRPIYDRITRQMPVAEQRASPGLKALQNILDSPDYMPVSIVDSDLSAIKELARTNGMPRNVSQGVAAAAVKELDDAVRAAVSKGGPDAIRALREGRTATIAKWEAADTLRGLRDEPVQAYRQMTYAGDAGIQKLREVAALAPSELPKVGRAFMDDLLNTATAEGSFSRAQGLFTRWNALGPETKRLMFRDPALVKDIDRFFLLAKKIGENPNPSGTAGVLTALNVGSSVATLPLAKLFYSRRGVQLLTRGIQIPLGSKAAVAGWVHDVTKAIGELPEPAMMPAAAGSGSEEAPKAQRSSR